MQRHIRWLVVVLMACLPLPSLAASAGRVLLALGDVSAQRGNERIVLSDGMTLETGDTLHVGDKSHLQALMSDQAVLSLRANTSLILETYRTGPRAEDNASVLNLLKGGLRTVTGMIGKVNHDGYQVKTVTSVIGVRGTHFALVQCAGNCIGADGAKAPDGLFGGVTDGRISVKNDGGEKEFGQREYFYVASREVPAQSIPKPPTFLRDPLEARARAKPDSKQAAAAASPAKSAGSSSGSGDSGSSTASASAPAAGTTDNSGTASGSMITESSVTASASSTPSAASTISAAPTTSIATAAPPTTTTAVSTTATAPASQPVIVGVAYNVATLFTSARPGFVALDNQWNEGFGIPPYIQTDVRQVPVLEWRLNAFPTFTLDSVQTDPATGAYIETDRQTTTKSASINVGSAADIGNVYWGQYLLQIHTVVLDGVNAGQVTDITKTNHWAIGDGPTALPTSGNYVYNWVGGSIPTNAAGATGQTISGGQIGVNFSSQIMSSLSPILLQGPSGISYSVGFSGSFAPTRTTETDPATGQFNNGTRYGALTTATQQNGIDATSTSSCSGCFGAIHVAEVTPMFYGNTGQGLGLAVGTRAKTSSTGPIETTASVQVYRRQ